MATFGFNDAGNYGQGNAGSYFSLKDEGDTARVRFLYKGIEDVEGTVVHEIHTDGDPTNIRSRKLINCLRSYDEPLDKCPFCASGYKQVPKLFLRLFNEDTGEAQLWERGKSYFQRLAGLASHYNPLCNEIISIERHGKKGDMQTKYEFYPIESSEFDMDSVEMPTPFDGSTVIEMTPEEMNDYIQTGTLTSEGESVAAARSSEVGRRTPSNTNPPRRAF